MKKRYGVLLAAALLLSACNNYYFDMLKENPASSLGEPSPVTGVTVTPNPASVVKGGSLQFDAEVSGMFDDLTVTWTVQGNGPGTTIDPITGLLTVAAAETAASLTVTATSNADTSISDSVTVTVTDPPVRVFPNTATVEKGGTLQFWAAVNGPGSNLPVTWTVQGNGPGTTIDPTTGLLTVAAGETATSLTVKATNNADNSQYGIALVTVTEYVARVDITFNGMPQDEVFDVTAGATFDWEGDDPIIAAVDPPSSGAWSSYQWYVDNQAEPGATSDTLNKTARDFSVGRHFITVRVEKDGMVYSRTVSLLVQ